MKSKGAMEANMIVLIRKKNFLLVGLLLLFSITVFSIGFAVDYSTPVTGEPVALPSRTIILDAGHGGEDPGAVSDYSNIREKEINLDMALMVKDLLEKDSYKVILTRDADVLEYSAEAKNIIQKRKEDLLRRKKIMDESNADIVVSIHLNKFPQTQYHGAQTFFPPNSPESQKLATEIQNSIRLNVDNANERAALVKKDPIIILKNLKTTTVVVECGFLSNADEEKRLGSKDYQQKIASAIKLGIDGYFKNSTAN
jgi:N-acetylmuramoyl-L-alanine amidase